MRPFFLLAALTSGLLASLPAGISAQYRLVDPRNFAAAPSYLRWSFSTPFETDSLSISEVSQLSLPFSVSFSPARNLRVDVSAAYAKGTVTATGTSGGTPSTLSLDGLTDAKIRAVGRLANERVWLTLGLNLPTGLVRLSNEEAATIRVIGAPAFRMNAPALGGGTGVTVGGIYTATLGRWALGFGASYELRGTYTPLEASLAGGGTSEADLDPAEAVHISLAFDRLVGQGSMSFLFVGDRYGTDLVTVRTASGATDTQYQLGPTFTAQWEYRLATPRIRDLRFSAIGRYRSAFSEASGDKADGSSGTMLDAGVSATIGRAGGTGVLVAVNGAFDAGLDIDDTVATAAMTSATLTLGLDLPAGRFVLLPFVRAGLGQLDAGPETTSGKLLGGGIMLRTEW